MLNKKKKRNKLNIGFLNRCNKTICKNTLEKMEKIHRLNNKPQVLHKVFYNKCYSQCFFFVNKTNKQINP